MITIEAGREFFKTYDIKPTDGDLRAAIDYINSGFSPLRAKALTGTSEFLVREMNRDRAFIRAQFETDAGEITAGVLEDSIGPEVPAADYEKIRSDILRWGFTEFSNVVDRLGLDKAADEYRDIAKRLNSALDALAKLNDAVKRLDVRSRY